VAMAAQRGWMLGTGYSHEVSTFRISAFLWHAFGGEQSEYPCFYWFSQSADI